MLLYIVKLRPDTPTILQQSTNHYILCYDVHADQGDSGAVASERQTCLAFICDDLCIYPMTTIPITCVHFHCACALVSSTKLNGKGIENKSWQAKGAGQKMSNKS